MLNRQAGTDDAAILEKHQGEYTWGGGVPVACRVAGCEIEVAIPLAALNLSQVPAYLDFKWADNIQQTGEASDFTINGDVAPNDRFNYRAKTGD